MKFRSYGAEIVSDLALDLGRQQNEPNQRVNFRDFNFQTLQKKPKGGPVPAGHSSTYCHRKCLALVNPVLKKLGFLALNFNS